MGSPQAITLVAGKLSEEREHNHLPTLDKWANKISILSSETVSKVGWVGWGAVEKVLRRMELSAAP